MTSGAARLGAALGTLAAFAMAMVQGGLTAWAAGAFAVGGLVLVAAVLFVPSETPARRLGRLLQAWHGSTTGAAGPEPSRRTAPPSATHDGL
ncbi:hypothetical protein SAMN05216489_00763 [Streptomyces sp. 3213]|uniref:hypothetical protein n=1 Tax=Streptomyces sp. 3213.3 TaxID=1855348 RepID=UPI00089A6D24|nr:hypothetical protein [Streptomyces sp. 3213.3]SEC44641.1 hypothetical protein SAMN05216489_00763 [Streptomyces sp. 3213] [Streptomyces sp. 3213.3]